METSWVFLNGGGGEGGEEKGGKNRTGWKPETTRRAGSQEIALISY